MAKKSVAPSEEINSVDSKVNVPLEVLAGSQANEQAVWKYEDDSEDFSDSMKRQSADKSKRDKIIVNLASVCKHIAFTYVDTTFFRRYIKTLTGMKITQGDVSQQVLLTQMGTDFAAWFVKHLPDAWMTALKSEGYPEIPADELIEDWRQRKEDEDEKALMSFTWATIVGTVQTQMYTLWEGRDIKNRKVLPALVTNILATGFASAVGRLQLAGVAAEKVLAMYERTINSFANRAVGIGASCVAAAFGVNTRQASPEVAAVINVDGLAKAITKVIREHAAIPISEAHFSFDTRPVGKQHTTADITAESADQQEEKTDG